MIRAEDVYARYSKRGPWVLEGVSFALEPGELVAILGPNGSGKSTLVRALDGLLRPERGRVLLDGKPIESLSRRDVARSIGYVAQTVDLHFPLTVVEYVLQGRFAHGRGLGFETDEDLAAAESAMAMTETTAFASRRLTELSGGERQRCMLARAVAQGPRALLLDEPTANLDASHQVRMLDLVRRLAHGCRIGAIVVTHELNLACEFADRVLLLKDGTVRGLGSPADVLTRETVEEIFETPVLVDRSPASGAPRITLVAPRETAGPAPVGTSPSP